MICEQIFEKKLPKEDDYSLGKNGDREGSNNEAGDRDGLNWYAYVGYNPLRYTDPTGLYYDRINKESDDTGKSDKEREKQRKIAEMAQKLRDYDIFVIMGNDYILWADNTFLESLEDELHKKD